MPSTLNKNSNVIQLPLDAHCMSSASNHGEAFNDASLSYSSENSPKSLRLTSNSALAHLKALGPRLTSAQRKSIALLQAHELVGSRSIASNEEVAQIRRSKFTLV